MNFLKLWFKVLVKPKETFSEEKAKASVIAGFLHLVIFFILVVFLGVMYTPLEAKDAFYLIVYIFSLGNVFVLMGVGLFYVIARLFGGKGTFSQQYYLHAIFFAPIFLLITIALIIKLDLFFIVLFLLLSYYFYLLALSLKEVHGFGRVKAVFLGPLFVLFLFLLLILGIF